MRIFAPDGIKAQPYEERHLNVFYQVPEFKMRIIQLPPGGALPDCQMREHVIFFVLSGSATILIDGETSSLTQGQCLVSPPASFRMTSQDGVKIMGIQIAPTPRP